MNFLFNLVGSLVHLEALPLLVIGLITLPFLSWWYGAKKNNKIALIAGRIGGGLVILLVLVWVMFILALSQTNWSL